MWTKLLKIPCLRWFYLLNVWDTIQVNSLWKKHGVTFLEFFRIPQRSAKSIHFYTATVFSIIFVWQIVICSQLTWGDMPLLPALCDRSCQGWGSKADSVVTETHQQLLAWVFYLCYSKSFTSHTESASEVECGAVVVCLGLWSSWLLSCKKI